MSAPEIASQKGIGRNVSSAGWLPKTTSVAMLLVVAALAPIGAPVAGETAVMVEAPGVTGAPTHPVSFHGAAVAFAEQLKVPGKPASLNDGLKAPGVAPATLMTPATPLAGFAAVAISTPGDNGTGSRTGTGGIAATLMGP
jgi:hypothetical protein